MVASFVHHMTERLCWPMRALSFGVSRETPPPPVDGRKTIELRRPQGPVNSRDIASELEREPEKSKMEIIIRQRFDGSLALSRKPNAIYGRGQWLTRAIVLVWDKTNTASRAKPGGAP